MKDGIAVKDGSAPPSKQSLHEHGVEAREVLQGSESCVLIVILLL